MFSMARTKRRFTAEYRVEAAHRVIDSGRPVAEVSRELGVGEQLLGRWVRDERVRISAATAAPDIPEAASLNDAERAELARLRRRVVEQEKRIADQEQDVMFLKKASAYFASMQPK
jgi:transposase